MSFKSLFHCSFLFIFLMSSTLYGAVTKTAANKLGKTLTPFGAAMHGNSSGTIPVWRGGIKMPLDNYGGPGRYHPDPFDTDKPLFSITADNMNKYVGRLSEGHKVLLISYPNTFRLPVYQTRRSHSAPEWVYENTKVNALNATLVAGGNGVKKAYGGIPFPITNNAQEVMWNHLLRWRGTYFLRSSGETTVQRNGDYVVSFF